MTIESFQPPPARTAPVLQDTSGKTQGMSAWVFQMVWSGWFRKITATYNANLAAGFSGTVPLAKLTTGGTNGSLTIQNGIITSVVAPT